MFNLNETELIDQYIKRIATVGMARLPQVAYYEAETFVDLYTNPVYMISNFGRIYAKNTNRIVLSGIDQNGYSKIELDGLDKHKHSYYIHDLVMMSFAPRPDYGPNCDFLIKHINGNRTLNVYCPGHPWHNLDWSDSIQYLQFVDRTLPKDYDEEFRPFPMDRRYLISNKGKVFSLINGCFLAQKVEKGGYLRLALNGKMYSVHRLVMLTFAFRPDHASLEVNHIDGNKANNVYLGEGHPATNLEWCTSMENRQHAVKNDLVAYGDKAALSIFTEKFIESVCEVINAYPSLTSLEIASKMNIPFTTQFQSLVSQLRCGVRWRRVVEKYPNICRVEHAAKYTEPFVRQVCQTISNNPDITAPEIATVLDAEYTEAFQRLIHKLRNGETRVNIAREYPNVIRRKRNA